MTRLTTKIETRTRTMIRRKPKVILGPTAKAKSKRRTISSSRSRIKGKGISLNRPENKTVLSSHLKHQESDNQVHTDGRPAAGDWGQSCRLPVQSHCNSSSLLLTLHYSGVGGSNLPSGSTPFQRCGWKTIPAHPHHQWCGWGGCAQLCASHHHRPP